MQATYLPNILFRKMFITNKATSSFDYVERGRLRTTSYQVLFTKMGFLTNFYIPKRKLMWFTGTPGTPLAPSVQPPVFTHIF